MRGPTWALLCLTFSACTSARIPCAHTVGADVCSMVPVQFECECDGELVEAAPQDQPIACGQVQTVCIGRVTTTNPSPYGLPLTAEP